MKAILITDSLPLGQMLIKSFRKEGFHLELFLLNDSPEKMSIELEQLSARVLLAVFNDMSNYQKILPYLPDETIKASLAYDFSRAHQNWRDHYHSSYLYPFDFSMISMAVRNEIFQRSKAEAVECLQYNGLKLLLNQRELRIDDQSFFLKHREFCLLQFLMSNPGKLLSRMSILENVWDMNADAFTNTVEVHISKLRKIFRLLQIKDELIKTVPCSGYIFGKS